MHDWTTTFHWSQLAPIAGVARRRSWAGSSRRAVGMPTKPTRKVKVASGRSISSILESRAVKQTGRSQDGPEPRIAQRILDEDLFRSALIRERKRADRFDAVFALITISVDPTLLRFVAAAMAAATSDTDITGWMEQGTMLGVILTELPRSCDTPVHQTEMRLQREMTRRLDAAAVERLEVRCYVHRGPGVEGAQQLSEADPLLDDLRSTQARLTLLYALKRTLDILGSAALLVLTSPIFLIVAALVKLTSPGPVLFKQLRVGHMAKPFTMLKFRTMQVNNDPALHREFVTDFIKSGSHARPDGGQAPFKINKDPRTTSIGRVLRRTSLDELPQLWNVLRGDMSLVGPRPPIAYELENYRSWHWRRVLEAKPGLTGLWQVTGRSRTTFDEMVRLDLRYARTRSLWLDLKIILATPRAVITGKGAR